MPKFGYSAKVEEPAARAYGREIRASPKDAVEVCRAIRGMKLEAARKYLEGVRLKRAAVPFLIHGKKLAHRRGMKGSGAYPVKVAGALLKLLKSAEENAKYKGLDPEKLRIIHASACKGITIPGVMPRAFGRASPANKPLTNVEIILKEA